MRQNKNRRYLIVNIIAVTLVLLVTAVLAFYFVNTDKTVAALENQIEIKIDKVTTISIYAFGPGVEFVSSTNDYDLYTVERGTTVRLQAINETRIFTDWVITKNADSAKTEVPSLSINQLENEILNFEVTENMANLDVSVNRRNATADDYGKYMMDRFVIVNEGELLALQNILSGSYEDEDFAKYYKNPDSYATNDDKDELREDLQKGYFLIANNFTVFNEEFTGLGTSTRPFEGIMCGKNGNVNSKLFITINGKEKSGESAYGLFSYLGERAVVRNLIVSTSIGIQADTPIGSINDDIIYAGGLAGVMNKSTLIDVVVSTSVGIESNNVEKIYAGGLAGIISEGSGIDSISDVVYDGKNSKWSIVSHLEDSLITAGFVAGEATDAYIKEIDITVTDQLVDLKNDSTTKTITDSKLYLGNVFGKYVANNHEKTIDDIMIMGNSGESLRIATTNGEASVGGLIGHVDANTQNGKLNIEKVYFRVLNTKNEYSVSTIKTDDAANLYAGGIIGYVNGENVYALDDFKHRFQNVKIDEDTSTIVANYLFEGDYLISATQNGTARNADNGKAIAGGIIGKGFINLSGTNSNDPEKFAIVSKTSSLTIEAIQSKLTGLKPEVASGTETKFNDKEHAAAALIFGSVGDNDITVENIDIYTNNTTIQTIREIGSKAMGDLHTGGFIGYAVKSNFSNIGLYFNDCSLLAESLSYEAKNEREDTNSAFCGGFAGELLGNSNLTNIEFAGYDVDNLDQVAVVGTTSHLESIQNTIPGGDNYRGENYIGGIVGRIQYAALKNCDFIGSTGNKDYIRMSGHESPDSAFCGGIVGMIRTAVDNVPSEITDCDVTNTQITGNATNINTSYSNPDIYIGGIVGAAYLHSTNSTAEITNCTLTKSSVYALGNELIATYAGGIIGGATWQSSIDITDCYVTDSSIKSNTSTTISGGGELESSSAGIVALKGDTTTVNVSHCVVIDTEVDAKVNSNYTNIKAYAAGIVGYTENNKYATIKNCYSNALVTASHQNASGTANIYGIGYQYTNEVSTDNKTVTGNVTTYTFKGFELNGYTFELADASGKYRIKRNSDNQYIYIWRNRIYYGSLNNASQFTFDNGNLVNNNRYISFTNTTIGYGNTTYDFTNSAAVKQTITGSVTEKYFQSYYLKKNAKEALDSALVSALGTGPYDVPITTDPSKPVYTNPYTVYDYINGFDGTGQKFYIEILDNESPFAVIHENNRVVSLTSSKEGVALAHIWINAKADGGPIIDGNLFKPNHENKAEAASHGWFILDYVLLTTGDLATIISSDLSNIDTSYLDGSVIYEFVDGDNDDDPNTNGKYLINSNDEKITKNYLEEDVKIEDEEKIKEFTFDVYDEMLTLNVDFEVTHFGANYKLVFFDENKNMIDDSEFSLLYGDIELTLTTKHASNSTDKYNLTYKPNVNIENDVTFYIELVGGNDLISAETLFKVNLNANEFILKGVTYADYTPPLNYYDTDSTIGTTEGNAYQLYVDSTTKFIPIFTKSNDLINGKEYVLEEYIEKCTYSLADETYFSIRSSGDVKTSNTAGKSTELTLTYGSTSKTVYITSVAKIPVTYMIVGADIEGLVYATNTTNFYFEQYIRSNYSGIPTSSIITIAGIKYDLTANPAAYQRVTIDGNEVDGIKIYAIAKDRSISSDPISSYNADAIGYIIEVNQALLNESSDVTIEISYPIVYTISFELQCEKFNPEYTGGLNKTYKVVSGTTYKEFFQQPSEDNPELTNKEEILQWVEESKIFGYVFTGFYLVSDANSINSYGISFDQLSESTYAVNSSNTFYGRWSYLIELVEAPGTHIKTGFNSEFMQNYVLSNAASIQIPINANQGYLFRVDTDSNYQGKPEVEAYVVTIDENSIKQSMPIPVEIYPENENLYYIRPEYITGYLVVMTTVSNSDVIVGENTSSVVDDITTEDGIITFKYVVNHYNVDGKKSYIYNVDEYENLTKEFVLDFYKQSDRSVFIIPDLTEIRVYYNRYVNGTLDPSKTIVGSYITHNDDRVYLTEFVQLDLETPAFPSDVKFSTQLADAQTVTEVYYFTITPPNGYSKNVLNEMTNYVVECGYCYGKVNKFDPIEYLEGARTTTSMANESELGDVVDNKESAKQEKEFHIVPSRQTTLVKETDGSYTFTDDKTYPIYDITLTDTQKLPDFHYISLYDDTRQSTLESSTIKFGIKELRLTLGYRLGKVRVLAKKEATDAEWVLIDEINVTSAVYSEYSVSFKGTDNENPYPYKLYKLDNISTNEIRVSQIDVVSKTNGVVYEGPASSFEEKSVVNNQYTYSLVHQIVGDARHDGKKFMLAVQLADGSDPSDIIEDILNDIYIKVNDIGLDINHYVYLNEYSGKNTAYINLSNILATLNVKSMNFNIYIPAGYAIYSTQLLEVTNEYKPLSGEVRVDYTQIYIPEPETPSIENPSKATLKVDVYDNSGLVSGKSTTGTYRYRNINYLCDRTGILPNNSLTWQHKILLRKIDDVTYYIVDVVGAGTSVKNRTDWDYAIATAYETDSTTYYTNLYSNYVGHYLILESPLTKNTAAYTTVYTAIVNGTWKDSTNANIYQYQNTETATVHYDLNGGEWGTTTPSGIWNGDIFESTTIKDSVVTLPTPKKSGYRFLGWYEVGQKVTSLNARDCMLMARWIEAKILVVPYDDGNADTYQTIAAALADAQSGDTIYLSPGTYSEALTVNKENITFAGPNAGISGQSQTRNSEAIITGLTNINSDYTKIDGVKFTKAIKVGADNVTITNCYITPTATVSCNNGNGRKGCIVDSANISDLTVSNCYINVPGTTHSYTTQYMSFNNITNLTISGNYITNTDHTSVESGGYAGMRIYTSAGFINIDNNIFKFGTTGYVMSIGASGYENNCTNINIVDNVFDKNDKMSTTAGIRIMNGESTLKTTIIGNEIYNCTGNIFRFDEDNGSTVEIIYNNFGNGTIFKVGDKGSSHITLDNNYYAESSYSSNTTIVPTDFNNYSHDTSGLENYKSDYEEYKG